MRSAGNQDVDGEERSVFDIHLVGMIKGNGGTTREEVVYVDVVESKVKC